MTSSDTESFWEDPGLERRTYRLFVSSLTSCTQFRWCSFRFVEVLIAQLVKKFPAVRGTLWFKTLFTRILHWQMSSIPALTQYFFNIHFNIIFTQPRRFSKLFFTPGLYAKSYVYTRSQSVSQGSCFFWPQYGNGVMEYIRSKERGVYLKMLPSDGRCEECTRILRANVFRLAISSWDGSL